MSGLTAWRCPVCGSDASERYLDEVPDDVTGARFAVRRCLDCGLGVTVPAPCDLRPYYPPDYRRYHRLAKGMLTELYRRRMRAVTRELGASRLALELGCGEGWMLRALREHGWQVLGIERTCESAAAASREHRLPVIVGGLEAIRPGTRFDLIILFHVLEHVSDPLAILCGCARLLKPGGQLTVSVPNARSWQARLFRAHWFHLDVPRHLAHFSPQSLVLALERAGFEIRRVRWVSWEHDPYGWVQSSLNRMGFPRNRLTQFLRGRKRDAASTPGAIVMAIVGAALVLPSMLAALASWLVGAGAIVEMQAVLRDGREA